MEIQSFDQNANKNLVEDLRKNKSEFPEIKFRNLKRHSSKVQRNKFMNIALVSNKSKNMKSSKNISVLSNSLCNNSENLMNSKQIRKKSFNISFASLKQTQSSKKINRIEYSNPFRKDSILDVLTSSQKLINCMEKININHLKLDRSSLWSQKVQEKQIYINNLVCNSCILSKKILRSKLNAPK